MNARRFQRGSGCYQCESCKRQTRAVEPDHANVRLCLECYEIAGQENALSDNGPDWEYKQNAIDEIARLTALCIKKGGKL